MNACPSSYQLDQFARGQLNPSDAGAVELHLEQCEICRQFLQPITDRDTVDLDPRVVLEPNKDGAGSIPPEFMDHPRYRILEQLSVGGMGTVYKAEHRFLERHVVIKVIRPDLLSNPQNVRRFEREARLSAQLSHPNVVTVYEADRIGSTLFLVMEFLEGRDLALVSQRGSVQVAEACGWIQQAALGLEYIHERGMVHRDIKPSNLFLTRTGWVKVLDLGLAYFRARAGSGDAAELTLRGQVFGTVSFCSPEQLEQSSTVDIRSDIYSLGCTLYHLLAGQAPFANSSSLVEHIWAHRQTPVPPIRENRPDVPEELDAVLNRMLAKEADNRYSTPAEVAEALSHFSAPNSIPSGSGGRAISPASDEAILPGVLRKKKIRMPALAALAALLIVAAVVFFYWFSGRPGVQRLGLAGGPPIKVGILHSRSGTMAIDERPVIDATLFAIEEINASGGLLGRRVEAIVEDGQSDAQTFAERAEKLIAEDKVSTIFGCWTSASRKAVKLVIERHNHLLLYPVQNEGLEQSPNIVYLGAAPNQQIIPAVKWCTSFLKKKRLFLVGSDYIFPRAANAIIRDQVKHLGVEVVGEEYRPLGSSDMTQIAEKIRNSKADVILNTINGDANIAFFRALRAVGISSSVVPTISFSTSEDTLSSLRPQDLEGDYAAWNYFQNIDNVQNKGFVSRFQQRFGLDRVISDPMEAAYAGVQMWARAVQASSSEDPAVIRSAIAGQSLDAPEGKIRIDAATMRTSKFIRIAQMSKEGQFEVIYSSDVAIEPIPYPETRSRADWDAFVTDLQLGWGGQWANPGR